MGILLLILLVALLIYVFKGIIIVQQQQEVIIERMGRYEKLFVQVLTLYSRFWRLREAFWKKFHKKALTEETYIILKQLTELT